MRHPDEQRAEEIADLVIKVIRSKCDGDEDLRCLVAQYVYNATALRKDNGELLTRARRHLRGSGRLTKEQMMEFLGVGDRDASRVLKWLCETGGAFPKDGAYEYRSKGA